MEFQQWFQLLQNFGLPVVAFIGLGVFVWVKWWPWWSGPRADREHTRDMAIAQALQSLADVMADCMSKQ